MSERGYRYHAARGDGRLERGRLAATSRSAALRALADRGLHPIDVAPESGAYARRGALSLGDLALALRLLADLLDAGLPVARAIQLLETMVAPSVAVLLPSLLAAVREGRSLAAALEQSEVTIPAEVLGVIRAGERGSGLAAAVRQAAELCEDAAATRAALRSALAYPLLLAVAGTASLCLLVGVVLPRFAAILGDLGQTLPASTRLVLRGGTLARVGALPAVLAGGTAALAWRAWTATPEGRRRWHALLLAAPVIGELRGAAASARLCASLAALLSSGVPVAPAIRSAASSAGDAEMTARVLAARVDVEHGGRLSDALARHRAASPLVQRLVRAGEESGRLAPMLAHAGRLERERVLRRVRDAVRLIEPAMIVGFGGVVALVAAALLQALYSIRPGT
jgi:general secretion pathway protein F